MEKAKQSLKHLSKKEKKKKLTKWRDKHFLSSQWKDGLIKSMKFPGGFGLGKATRCPKCSIRVSSSYVNNKWICKQCGSECVEEDRI